MNDASETVDSFLWLEEVDGERALAWVEARNRETLGELESDPRYAPLYRSALEQLTADDRIPYAVMRDGWVFNFWQDGTHERGLWRRMPFEAYIAGGKEWEVLLDFDALAEREHENWVFKGSTCLPGGDRCLLQLSRGGADAVVVREFDLASGEFTAAGFDLPEAKQSALWLERDALLVTTPLHGGSVNTSGYAREVRVWQRGMPLEDAPVVLRIDASDAFAQALVQHRPEGREVFLARMPDFFHEEIHHLDVERGEAVRLALPDDVDFRGIIKGWLVVLLRSDWSAGGGDFEAGSLVAVRLDEARAGTPHPVVIEPKPARGSIVAVGLGRDVIYVQSMRNVAGELHLAAVSEDGFEVRSVDLPDAGSVSIVDVSPQRNVAFVAYEGFLTAPRVLLAEPDGRTRTIAEAPARFDAARFTVSQHWARSKDGTGIPYFEVGAPGHSGPQPTLMYGYGGFEVALTPSYVSAPVQAWLAAGGRYVVANIRGGGEFGPAWHRAALKENRQRAFDDFAAVGADLIERGVTAPGRLGIYGGSNGGLLVGASLVQHPELWGAVVCAVPLLDMLRYHKLLAGASWIGEYGDPDDPEERAFIARYSPYQNVRSDGHYPPVLFMTSTRDDRVHPGHARKMAARMRAQGHRVLYFENTEGGHAGAANLEQTARQQALYLVFLMRELMPED